MRLFDTIGVVSVAAWIGLVAAYGYELYFQSEVERIALDSGVPIRAGDAWMVLTREDAEIGFIHETRTPIEAGWLLEYDFLMNVTSLGSAQLIRTNVKATVDHTAVLQKAQIKVDTANTFTLEADARTEGNEVILEMTMGGVTRTRRIPFKEPPRLAQSVFFQLAARDELKPGEVFEQQYFDPIAMGMTSMRFEYVRRHTVDVYDRQVEAFHFVQKVINDEYDVYLDADGEVQIQELPLRIIAARVPSEYGQTRGRAMEREFKTGRTVEGTLTAEDAIGLIRGGGGLKETSVFEVKNLPADWRLLADSGSQKVVSRKEESLVIDTTLSTENIDSAPVGDDLLEVDSDLDASAITVPDLGDAPQTIIAEKIARDVKEKAEASKISSFESARLLVDGLRRAKIPARMVYGVQWADEGVTPLYWAQYHRNEGWVDLDPGRVTLLPSTQQIQITVEPLVTREDFESELSKISITRVNIESGAEADFN